jgi:predicted ATPase
MERLIIKNFGPVTSLDIELKKINVFIGGQGVGKSTVAKVLSCVRDITFWALIIQNNKNAISDFNIYELQHYFSDETYIKYIAPGGFVIEYEKGIFSIAHDSFEEVKIKQYILAELWTKANNMRGLDTDETINDSIFQKYSSVLALLRTSFYLPVERNLTACISSSLPVIFASKVPLPQTLLEYLGFYARARHEYPVYDIPFLKLSLLSSKEGDEVISIDNKTIPLKECSSGVQSVVPLLMVIDYCLKQHNFDSFAIEEPELSLFPSNQLELMRILISKTNDVHGMNNLIITTHSPYLLSILNNFILAKKVVDFKNDTLSEVNNVISEKYFIGRNDIAVYSLGNEINEGAYCKSVIDEKTGMIMGNYLDAVSEIVSSEFEALSKIYLKSLKGNGGK